MDFLHCHDLPLWAQILLYPIESADSNPREEQGDGEHEAVAAPCAM